MAYSVRGKYSNQEKYSDRRVNQLLDLTAIQAKDSLLIEEGAQRAVDKASDAVKKSSKFGFIRKALNFVPGVNLATKAVLAIADAAYADRLRDNSIRGLDNLDQITYYGDAAAAADKQVLETTKKMTKGMKFGDKALDAAKDLALDKALEAIKKSEAFADFKKEQKVRLAEIKDKGLGQGRLIDFVFGRDKEAEGMGQGFYFKEIKKYFSDVDAYEQAVFKYQNKDNPIYLLQEKLIEDMKGKKE
jgi:hypothetical protein|tara:strand:+ start:2770 stop:3504 length:735 start_codon:yes stop_codon:yes gene_type:complete